MQLLALTRIELQTHYLIVSATNHKLLSIKAPFDQQWLTILEQFDNKD